MDELCVTSEGQVTIPKAVRQRLGIRAGSRVRFSLVGDHAELQFVHAACCRAEQRRRHAQTQAFSRTCRF